MTVGMMGLFSSCADNKFTTPGEKLTTKIETSINDLITCPTAGSKEYKFIDAFKLSEPAVKPEVDPTVLDDKFIVAVQAKIKAKHMPKTLNYNDISFTLSVAYPFGISIAEKEKPPKECDLIDIVHSYDWGLWNWQYPYSACLCHR